ncbi:MAG TPA: ATP-binding cassette domain-containing protein [Streptosporangiaceae bacterium]|nr:ATP-binding cassette domain-containing protein [Streptosporangiaceae bacterium]
MTTTSEPCTAIEALGLGKAFGAVKAVDGLDLSVPSGGVFALLGPNGAGKTTTIRILATLTRPDVGTARVLGHDVTSEPHAVRAGICLTGQFATIDASLTGTENLLLQGRLLGLTRRAARARAAELLDAFGLPDAAGRPVRTYSGGLQRRLDIAASLVVAPALLFLDEPTTGLDPYSRIQVWQAVRWLVTQGTTVLLTTQYLDEADRLADRIAVIDHGKVVAEGTPGELKSSVGSGVLRVELADARDSVLARQVLGDALGVPVTQSADPAVLTARIDGPSASDAAARGLALLSREWTEVAGFSLGQPSLDEVFLALTGHSAAQPADVEEPA